MRGKRIKFILGLVAALATSFGKPVCSLFQNLPSYNGKTVEVAGVYTTQDLDDALLPAAACQSVYQTQGYSFSAGIALRFPNGYIPGPAGAELQGMIQEARWTGHRRRITVVVRGRLEIRADYGFGVDNAGVRRPSRGFGHSKAYAAELIVERVLKASPLPGYKSVLPR